MLVFLSALPILALFFLIIAARRTALVSAGVSLVILLAVGLFLWGMTLARIASASAKGVFIATEIIVIVFGALLIYEMLRHTGLFAEFQRLAASLSKDIRVQVMFIAFTLVYFIEGVAGFGTPALVAVPLLMVIGMRPAHAVSLALIGDTTPVIFGAIGLPVIYGIGASLTEGSGVALSHVTLMISAFNILGAALLVATLTAMTVWFRGGTTRHIIEFLPFALLCAAVVSLASFATALFVGPELPSVIGGFTGLATIYLLAKRGILVPAHTPPALLLAREEEGGGADRSPRSVLWSILPYALLVALLLLSRLPYRDLLQSVGAVRVSSLFGETVGYTFLPLYSGSSIILAAFLISALLLRIGWNGFAQVVSRAARKITRPYATLLVLLAFVQIFIVSGENASGLLSMPAVLAGGAQSLFGPVWPLAAPFVGALGAFVAGSATVSNLLFSDFQYNTALSVGMSATLVLALQGLGAAAGNAIALHNIVAALAVSGSDEKEGSILRRNILPLLFYTTLIGGAGLLVALFF